MITVGHIVHPEKGNISGPDTARANFMNESALSPIPFSKLSLEFKYSDMLSPLIKSQKDK